VNRESDALRGVGLLIEQAQEAGMKCIECGQVAYGQAIGWRAYRADLEPDDEPDIVFYCTECGTREFGPPLRVAWNERRERP
jgi:hypothetical protein